METYKERCLRHKYDELPEHARYKKMKKRNPIKRAKHRHEYENCIVYARPYSMDKNAELVPNLASRCSICGKVGDFHQDELSERYGIEGSVFGGIMYRLENKVDFEAFLQEASDTYEVYEVPDKRMLDIKFIE